MRPTRPSRRSPQPARSAPGGVEWSLDLSRTHVVRRRAWVRSYEMMRDSEAEGAGGRVVAQPGEPRALVGQVVPGRGTLVLQDGFVHEE